jgi:hypothetical protein
MDITRDEKLYNSFEELTESLRRSLHSRDDAELLFWVQVYNLVNQSKIVEKPDAFGIIMNRVTGTNEGCNEIYRMIDTQADAYIEFVQKYQISDVLTELGEHWKRLLRRPSIVYALALRAWVKGFVDDCMPGINKILSECEAEWKDNNQLTEDDIKARQRKYKAYRTRLRKLVTKLDTLKEHYNVCREDPSFYNT